MIQNPNFKKYSILLLIVLILCGIAVFTHEVKTWMYVVGGISLASYYAVLIYYSVKEKNYRQLVGISIVVITTLFSIYLQYSIV
ncbi:MAG: hypothetical protein HDT07_00720 [Bacteroidales bacterium]|nr:hypothetical protein [Bacteroidales bacterium]